MLGCTVNHAGEHSASADVAPVTIEAVRVVGCLLSQPPYSGRAVDVHRVRRRAAKPFSACVGMQNHERCSGGRARAMPGLWPRVCIRERAQRQSDGEFARQRAIPTGLFRARITGWRPVCVLLSSYPRAGGDLVGERYRDDELKAVKPVHPRDLIL